MAKEAGRTIPLLLIAIVSSIGQFATNIQLPSFVAIAAEFHVAEFVLPLTLTVYLLAFAISQLFLGTASDWFGRKPILTSSLITFITGTSIAAAAPNMETLFVGRFVAGVGAGGAMVVGRAIIKDHFSGESFVRAIALVTALGALFPSVAPLVGGFIQDLVGWRLSLALISLIALVLLMLLLGKLCNERARTTDETLSWRVMLHSREFFMWSLGGGAAMGAMFAFFSGSPVVLVERLGISPAEFGFYPPIVAAFYVIGTLGVRTLSAKGRSHTSGALASAMLMIAGSMIIFIPMLHETFDKWFILIGAALFTCGLGAYLTLSVASAMNLFSKNVGGVAAIVGFAQTLGGAIGGAIFAVLQYVRPRYALPEAMLLMAAATAACALSLHINSKSGRKAV